MKTTGVAPQKRSTGLLPDQLEPEPWYHEVGNNEIATHRRPSL